MSQDPKQRSKFLSYVLRHDPASIGLELDAQGWAEIDAILPHAPGGMTRDELEEIVASSDKQRFAISGDGDRIRANQGHSVAVDLGLTPTRPPAMLFHGTGEKSVAAIMADGLQRRARRHVHLSPDTETARKVGLRHGRPAILRIDAAAMAAAGFQFFLSANGVWLTDHVPTDFLSFVE